MAKTNFTKVEEILDDGLRQIKVKNLLHETTVQNEKEAVSRLKILKGLEKEFKHLRKQGNNPYTKFGLEKTKLNHYLKNPEALSAEEWNKVIDIQKHVEEFKKEDNLAQQNNEALIEQQRRKSKTKRFNINDKWIPLK